MHGQHRFAVSQYAVEEYFWRVLCLHSFVCYRVRVHSIQSDTVAMCWPWPCERERQDTAWWLSVFHFDWCFVRRKTLLGFPQHHLKAVAAGLGSLGGETLISE